MNIEAVHVTTAFLAPDLDLGRFFSDTTYAAENLLLETPYVGSTGADAPPPIYPSLTQVNQELTRPFPKLYQYRKLAGELVYLYFDVAPRDLSKITNPYLF